MTNLPKTTINEFFKKQRKNPINKICPDCKNNSTVWINLSFSTFICSNCAGKHRNLGVNISKLKSTIHDMWTVNDLKRVFVGGNEKALKNLDFDREFEDRYKRGISYRSKIDAWADECSEEALFESGEENSSVLEGEVEIEEREVEKIGKIMEDYESEEEKCKKEEKKEVIFSRKYKVKTNEYSFMAGDDRKYTVNENERQRMGLLQNNVEVKNENAESKYCYKNVRTMGKKNYEEKTDITKNVKKIVVNAAESSKKVINNIMSKFKK